MPVHDWSRVDAGTFHAFHTAWMTHLSEAMNGGLLPSGYYALPEQHVGRLITDVLTLHAGPPSPAPPTGEGGLALAQAPPRVSRKLVASGGARARQRTLTVRHVTGHRIIALLEIVSPANKDRPSHVEELASKVVSALAAGVHVMLADLFPPGPHDPEGIHGAVWRQVDPDGEEHQPTPSSPLLLASYAAAPVVEAWLEPMAVGTALPDMPLFLRPDRYVDVPLEGTYQAAFRGMPGYWRDVLTAAGPA